MAAGRSTVKRPVYVNGTLCYSLSEGAKEATRILGRPIRLYQIHRVANGRLKISGIDVCERLTLRQKADYRPAMLTDGKRPPLLCYPLGERPLERGLTSVYF